ncbi:MAG TPA: AraC family transcriptional regulator [Clostridiaceae bacterium]|nr:AraC family transcriptional regulator [Clostridiaceae bacterium]
MCRFDDASRILREAEIDFWFDNIHVNVDFIAVDRFKPGGGYEAHLHSKYEFHYIKAGRGYVDMTGRRSELGPKSFYVCPPGVVHRQVADIDDPMVEYAMKCDLTIGEKKGAGNKEHNYLIEVLNSNTSVVKDNYMMDRIFENIFEEVENGKVGFLLKIKSAIMDLLIASLRNLSALKDAEYSIPKKDDNRLFELIREYINDNIDRCISCTELSKYFFLSEKQLNRIVMKYTGLTTYRFITACKIVTIKKLLSDTDSKLSDIAKQTGFSSEFHLSNRFKQFTGMSPYQYRNKKIQGDDVIFV